MPGIINFSISLLVLALVALGTLRKSRRFINFAFISMIGSCLLGWYQYIFPAGLSLLFFGGTLATVMVISSFFYAIYLAETYWIEERRTQRSS